MCTNCHINFKCLCRRLFNVQEIQNKYDWIQIQLIQCVSVLWLLYPLYSWLEPLFCIGARRTLEHSDLYAHPREADSGKLLKFFNM